MLMQDFISSKDYSYKFIANITWDFMVLKVFNTF